MASAWTSMSAVPPAAGGGRSAGWVVLLVAWVLGAFVAADAPGACKLNDDLAAARKNWEEAFKARAAVKLPAELEAKVGRMLSVYDLVEFKVEPGKGLSREEAELVIAYAAERGKKTEALEAATSALVAAQRAWNKAFTAKEAAMDEASKAFEAEQSHIRAERDELSKMKVNSKEYLDRASKLLDRLKRSYADITTKLAPHRDCFEDVETFLKDIEGRLVRIGQVEVAIVERRRENGEPVPPVAVAGVVMPLPGDGPPPGPLGDTWVLKPGYPKFWPDRKELFIRVDAKGFTYVKDFEGMQHFGEVNITKAPPVRLRVNELVEFEMTLKKADPRVIWSYMEWESNGFCGRLLLPEGRETVKNGDPPKQTGTFRCYFTPPPFDPNVPNPSVEVSVFGGEMNGNTMHIHWAYERAKP